jgi:hypothetical protein
LVLTRGKKNIVNATKHLLNNQESEQKDAIEEYPLQGSRGLNVDEIISSRTTLAQKVRQKRGGNHHRTGRLKQVAVFAFSHTSLAQQENYATSWRYTHHHSQPKTHD